MGRFEDDLKAAGWNKGPERFDELLANLFAQMVPGWTDEKLMCNPTKALEFVIAVRIKSFAFGLHEELIMRRINNKRKNSDW